MTKTFLTNINRDKHELIIKIREYQKQYPDTLEIDDYATDIKHNNIPECIAIHCVPNRRRHVLVHVFDWDKGILIK